MAYDDRNHRLIPLGCPGFGKGAALGLFLGKLHAVTTTGLWVIESSTDTWWASPRLVHGWRLNTDFIAAIAQTKIAILNAGVLIEVDEKGVEETPETRITRLDTDGDLIVASDGAGDLMIWRGRQWISFIDLYSNKMAVLSATDAYALHGIERASSATLRTITIRLPYMVRILEILTDANVSAVSLLTGNGKTDLVRSGVNPRLWRAGYAGQHIQLRMTVPHNVPIEAPVIRWRYAGHAPERTLDLYAAAPDGALIPGGTEAIYLKGGCGGYVISDDSAYLSTSVILDTPPSGLANSSWVGLGTYATAGAQPVSGTATYTLTDLLGIQASASVPFKQRNVAFSPAPGGSVGAGETYQIAISRALYDDPARAAGTYAVVSSALPAPELAAMLRYYRMFYGVGTDQDIPYAAATLAVVGAPADETWNVTNPAMPATAGTFGAAGARYRYWYYAIKATCALGSTSYWVVICRTLVG